MSRPLLIANARLIDPETSLDAMGSALIEGGKIVALGAPQAGAGVDIVDAGGLVLAPGVLDLRVKTGEPGAESKETLATASEAAAAGGVTSFLAMPDTQPVIDSVALVDFLLRRARDTACVKIYPAAGLTVGLSGEKMTEIGLIHEAGALLFSNGDQAVADAGVLRRALLYATNFDVLIASRPDTHAITKGAVMNAGAFAGRLGLKGAPPEAEWIAVERDATLAETTGARLLVDTLSTARSLEIVRQARRRGARISCSVAAYSLFFNELDVGDYLTYCKVFPPFRSEADREALIEGVRSGDIDAVVSAHDPQPPEDKRLPIGDAAFGAVGLETLLPVMLTLVAEGRMTLPEALRPLTSGPAGIMGLPQGRLQEGAPADLVLFDPATPWVCEREHLRSRSQNSPFDGRRLQGRVHRTFVDGRCIFSLGDEGQ